MVQLMSNMLRTDQVRTYLASYMCSVSETYICTVHESYIERTWPTESDAVLCLCAI